MEEEAACRASRRTERLLERSPRIEAVQAGGAVLRGGEGELAVKDIELLVERGAAESGQPRVVRAGAIEYPAVEPDLADGRTGRGGERGLEARFPGGGAVARMPGVEPVGRSHPGGGGGECGERGPVGLAGAVGHHAGDAVCGQLAQQRAQMGREGWGVQVVVRVEVHAVV